MSNLKLDSETSSDQKQLKPLIQLLCRILRDNANITISAECLRRSKFNDPSITPQLWKLLHLLLNFHEEDVIRGWNGGLGDCNLGGVDAFQAGASSSGGLYDGDNITTNNKNREFIVKLVKKSMTGLGYFNSDLNQLPENMEWGSRELLVAFGWLMCRVGVMRRFMRRRLKMFGDGEESLLGVFGAKRDGEKSMINSLRIGNTINDKLSGKNEENDISKENINLNLLLNVEKVLVVNTKLKMNLCLLGNMQQELLKKKHKIYTATQQTKSGGVSRIKSGKGRHEYTDSNNYIRIE